MALCKREIEYRCLDDCRQEGCPGHTGTLEFQSASNTYHFNMNGRDMYFEQNELQAMVDLIIALNREDSIKICNIKTIYLKFGKRTFSTHKIIIDNTPYMIPPLSYFYNQLTEKEKEEYDKNVEEERKNRISEIREIQGYIKHKYYAIPPKKEMKQFMPISRSEKQMRALCIEAETAEEALEIFIEEETKGKDNDEDAKNNVRKSVKYMYEC